MFLYLQTCLDETNAIQRAFFSISLYGNTDKIAEMLSLPPPLNQCCSEGLRIRQGGFGGKATLIRGSGGKICCGK